MKERRWCAALLVMTLTVMTVPGIQRSGAGNYNGRAV
jgi:hypothetical protein